MSESGDGPIKFHTDGPEQDPEKIRDEMYISGDNSVELNNYFNYFGVVLAALCGSASAAATLVWLEY